MSNKLAHPFHLVDYSPWPITGSLGTFLTMSGLIQWFHLYNIKLFMIGNMIIILTMYQWWRDVSRESTFQGLHTYSVAIGLRWGMILFITSEVLFFVSFFWAFFHISWAPSIQLGGFWPPMNIMTIDPFQVPALNTTVLMVSSLSLTWAHHSLLEMNHSQVTQGLLFTILLGIYFSILQGYEYMETAFSISDSAFGSIFFMATGFHGFHVLIGTSILLVSLLRHINNHFSTIHYFGFEAAAWYWHFVDMVWLFLYVIIYWLGG